MATFMDVLSGFIGETAQQLNEPDWYVFEGWYTRCDAY